MQNLRKMREKEDPLLKENWIIFKENLDSIINELKANYNIRIHDSETGGVLRGHIPTRQQNKELWENQSKFVGLLCRKENLDSEVGYSRALFNNKNIEIEDKTNGYIQHIDLIAYESPLLRKKSDRINKDIDSKFAKCDLIGLYEDLLFAIEVKIEPEEYTTYLPHALVESFAYGYYLNNHVQFNNIPLFNSEIHLCLEQFHPNLIIQTQDSYQVKYIVAAPKNYFMTYFFGQNKSQEWYERRKNETMKIEKLLFNEKSTFPKFGGYLTIDKSHENVMNQFDSNSPNCFPRFDTPLGVASLYPDFFALEKDLSQYS